MKRAIATILLLSTATSSLAQLNSTCVNADPSSTVAGISGDSEFEVDPQDPAQNVIYINNVVSGASSVVSHTSMGCLVWSCLDRSTP
jgi:hypothetical protein